MIVEPQPFHQGGELSLFFDHVSWQDLYIDPTGKRSGLCFIEYARSIYIAKIMPKRKAKNLYGSVPDDWGIFMKDSMEYSAVCPGFMQGDWTLASNNATDLEPAYGLRIRAQRDIQSRCETAAVFTNKTAMV